MIIRNTSRRIHPAIMVILGALLLPAGDLTANERQSREVDDARRAERLDRRGPLPLAPTSKEAGSSQRAVSGNAISDGIDWLATNQSPTGSWGTLFEFIDTATVVDALGRAQPLGLPFQTGANWLGGQLAADNDELSRQILALLQDAGRDVEDLVDDLLATRNPATIDVLAPNFPEGGWGLLPGFETDSLTTSLALMALEAAGRKAGIAVVDEPLAAAATNVHVWEIASDATKATIVISVAGSEVQVRMTEGAAPTGAEPFFSLPPGGPYNLVFPDSGIPFTPGANYIAVESPDPPGLAATYTFTASYETPTSDTLAFAEAVDYLRQSQNVDGGWGIQIGDPTSQYVTMHALLALLRYQDHDFDTELAAGVAYLQSQQLVDGSFGFSGVGVPYLTALGAMNLVRFEVCPFTQPTDDAIGALLTQQDPDNSWDQEAYDSSLAVQALWEYDNDGDGVFQDGDCSGTEGDNPCAPGMSTGCDDNCVDYANDTQGDVVFGQTIVAPDRNTLSWPQPDDIAFVKGDLVDAATYGVTAGGAAPFATSISLFDDNPAAGMGLYYLVRRAGDCTTTSWQTSPGAEPGRDLAPLGQIDVQITSPTDGAVLTASPVTVLGTVTGAEPIDLTVNGAQANVAGGAFDATVSLTRGANTITAMGTDAAGFEGSDQISVTLVDHSIAIGGFDTGSRIFTADSAVLDQVAFFTETQIGVPPGVVYTTLLVQRISATEMQVGFQIDVTGGANPGIYSFQVEYGLLDAAMMPLGPLTGNIFDFEIEVTP